MAKAGAIDIVVNAFTPQEVENKQTGFDANFMAQVRMPEEMRGGVTIEDYLRKMDAAGIERSLLIAVRAGEPRGKSFEIPYQQIAHIVTPILIDSPGWPASTLREASSS